MTLDEYRAYIVEKLTACQDPAFVPDVLAEAEVMLAATQVPPRAQDTFWHDTRTDLEGVRFKSLQLDQKAGDLLRSVIAAARTGIAHYQRMLASPTEDRSVRPK
jgi:hypothetical protein